MFSWKFSLAAIAFLAAAALAGRDCVVKSSGQTFKDGENFTIEMSGPCISYLCEDGGYSANSIKCADASDTCYDINATVTENCVTKTCVHNNTIGFEITDHQCPDDEGKCHKPGEVFTRTLKGTTYNNCNCEIDGSTSNIKCS